MCNAYDDHVSTRADLGSRADRESHLWRYCCLIRHIAPPALPSAAHLLALLVGLALVVLTPKLWRGTRTAVSLAISALLILDLVKGLDYEESALELGLALVLALGRRAFPLGSRNRPRLAGGAPRWACGR